MSAPDTQCHRRRNIRPVAVIAAILTVSVSAFAADPFVGTWISSDVVSSVYRRGRLFQPAKREARECDSLVWAGLAPLVQKADSAVVQNSQRGICGGALVNHLLHRPGTAVVAAESHGHACTLRIGGIGKQEAALTLSGGADGANPAGLAN